MNDVNKREDKALAEWNFCELGAWLSKHNDKYTLYHKGLEGRLTGLTYQELCQLAIMIENMIRDRK